MSKNFAVATMNATVRITWFLTTVIDVLKLCQRTTGASVKPRVRDIKPQEPQP